MSKNTKGGNLQFPAEFMEWLNAEKIPKKKRKDQQVLDQHYQRWLQLRKKTARKRSFLRLPNFKINLGSINNQVKTISTVLETLHQASEILRFTKTDNHDIG